MQERDRNERQQASQKDNHAMRNHQADPVSRGREKILRHSPYDVRESRVPAYRHVLLRHADAGSSACFPHDLRQLQIVDHFQRQLAMRSGRLVDAPPHQLERSNSNVRP